MSWTSERVAANSGSQHEVESRDRWQLPPGCRGRAAVTLDLDVMPRRDLENADRLAGASSLAGEARSIGQCRPPLGTRSGDPTYLQACRRHTAIRHGRWALRDDVVRHQRRRAIWPSFRRRSATIELAPRGQALSPSGVNEATSAIASKRGRWDGQRTSTDPAGADATRRGAARRGRVGDYVSGRCRTAASAVRRGGQESLPGPPPPGRSRLVGPKLDSGAEALLGHRHLDAFDLGDQLGRAPARTSSASVRLDHAGATLPPGCA